MPPDDWICGRCNKPSGMFGHIASDRWTCPDLPKPMTDDEIKAWQAENNDLCRKCQTKEAIEAWKAKRRSFPLCLCDYNLDFQLVLEESYQNAQAHGFQSDIWKFLGNLHSEVSEAWEEARKPDFEPTRTYYKPESPKKPEGLPSELADIVIRVADTARTFNIDLEQAIREKMVYNRSRPFKHGNKRA